MAVAVREKHKVRRAYLDFQCEDPGQKALVLVLLGIVSIFLLSRS